MTRKLRVFLCHASQDKPAVRELYNALNAEDWIDPWLDKTKILPGKNWRWVIEKAVEDADAVVVCLSNQAVSKEGFVQKEFKYAYDIALEKPEGTIFLIPLRLDDCNVPWGLRSFQYVNYFGFDKEESYLDLLKSLKERHQQVSFAEEEKLLRQQIEQRKTDEDARRLAAEQVAQENKARNERELEEREKKIVIAREKRERDAKKIAYQDLRRKKQREFVARIFKLASSNSRWLGIGGIVLISLLMVLFGGSYILNHLPTTEIPTLSPSLTFKSFTVTVTKTYTPFPPKPTITKTYTPPRPVSTPTPISTFGIGSTMISKKDNMVLVYVPAGEFLMGSKDSDSLASSDEKPQHLVTLDAFWIDQTEVTNKQYASCVSGGGCASPFTTKSYTRSSYYGVAQFDEFPVIFVNWNQANAYCSWVGRRLPTEAEWEKAARGTDGNIYPWGNGVPNKDLLNYNSNVGDTTQVGSYETGKSFYGAYDMAGNVWEWVNDWYQSGYYAAFGDNASNPQGPSSGDGRVLRGGSWFYSGYGVRSALRFSYYPSSSDGIFGFRCARSP